MFLLLSVVTREDVQGEPSMKNRFRVLESCALTTLLAGFGLMAGCGMMEPKYVKYEGATATAQDDEPPGSDNPDCDTEAAAAALKSSNVFTQATSATSCGAGSGCHGTGASNPVFQDVSETDLRKLLLASKYFSTDAAKFYDDLSKHAGGSIVTANLKESEFTDWLALEAQCQ